MLYSLVRRSRIFLVSLLTLGAFIIPVAVQAETSQLSAVSKVATNASTEQIYKSAQTISPASGNHAVYGKFSASGVFSLYKLTPDKDVDQLISLMVPFDKKKDALNPAQVQQPQVGLVLADPTNGTKAQTINLPVPSHDYHVSLITQLDQPRTYTEPLIFQKYSILAEQHLSLKAGKTYYLWVLFDPTIQNDHYVVKLGEDKVWQAKDVFQNFTTWFALVTDNYGGSSPFVFSVHVAGLLLFLLGLAVLLGIVLIQDSFSLMANASKAAAFTLIKMQPLSRWLIWIGLWFIILGGYIYFDYNGWVGIPFALVVLMIPIIINMLFVTLWLSPRVAGLTVMKQEATIGFYLRKRWFISTLISLFSFGAFLILLTQYLIK